MTISLAGNPKINAINITPSNPNSFAKQAKIVQIDIDRAEILDRKENVFNVADTVSEIIKTVREKGDAALFGYCERFDRVKLSSLEVSSEEIEAAFLAVEPEFVEILKEAKENIYAFHSRQVRNSFLINEKDGVVIGQKVIPIEKVGLYVPGGTAAYPSTVLMDSIPAKIAGCREVVMAEMLSLIRFDTVFLILMNSYMETTLETSKMVPITTKPLDIFFFIDIFKNNNFQIYNKETKVVPFFRQRGNFVP